MPQPHHIIIITICEADVANQLAKCIRDTFMIRNTAMCAADRISELLSWPGLGDFFTKAGIDRVCT